MEEIFEVGCHNYGKVSKAQLWRYSVYSIAATNT
jgi:hypothetical protein